MSLFETGRTKPFFTQVTPIWIAGRDEIELFGSIPTFDLLFPLKRSIDIRCRLVIDQELDIVFTGKSLDQLIFMLIHPPYQISRDPRIQRSRPVGHDVHIILFAHDNKY